MSLVPGRRLGPYEIVAPLGAGGMGEVYKARDTRLDRTVAIKVLPTELASNETLRARFEREAHAISALQHPHICTLLDVGEENGEAYLVMEHLAGETLADRLKKGPIPLAQALEIAIQIAEGLAAGQGVLGVGDRPAHLVRVRDEGRLRRPAHDAERHERRRVRVQHRPQVRSPECTGCMSCVAAGTVPSCLGVSRGKKVSPWLVPAVGVGVMLAFWGVAAATGHWTSEVPLEAFRRAYRMAPYIGH